MAGGGEPVRDAGVRMLQSGPGAGRRPPERAGRRWLLALLIGVVAAFAWIECAAQAPAAAATAGESSTAHSKDLRTAVEAALRAGDEDQRRRELRLRQQQFEIELTDQALRRGLSAAEIGTAAAILDAVDLAADTLTLRIVGPANLGSHTVADGAFEPLLFKGVSGIAHYPEELRAGTPVTLYAIVKVWPKRNVVKGQPAVVTSTWHLIGVRATAALPAPE